MNYIKVTFTKDLIHLNVVQIYKNYNINDTVFM
jgi:hypothetical protein